MMSNNILMRIHSAIYLFFAVALFFLPGILWPMYGVELNDQYVLFLSQHTSIFLGGIVILTFFFRNVGDNNEVAHKLFTGLMWTNVLGVGITLYACLTGVFVGFGWSDPAFFAVLGVLCFLQLKKNRSGP